MDRGESRNASPCFYIIEVSPAEYDRFNNRRFKSYFIPALSAPLEIAINEDPNLPEVILAEIRVGDSILFHCTQQTGEYQSDIEKKVIGISISPENNGRIAWFRQ